MAEKQSGTGDETGLGLKNDPTNDNEIFGTSLIRINFTNAVNAGVTGFTFQMGSTSGNENWAIFGSNSAQGRLGLRS